MRTRSRYCTRKLVGCRGARPLPDRRLAVLFHRTTLAVLWVVSVQFLRARSLTAEFVQSSKILPSRVRSRLLPRSLMRVQQMRCRRPPTSLCHPGRKLRRPIQRRTFSTARRAPQRPRRPPPRRPPPRGPRAQARAARSRTKRRRTREATFWRRRTAPMPQARRRRPPRRPSWATSSFSAGACRPSIAGHSPSSRRWRAGTAPWWCWMKTVASALASVGQQCLTLFWKAACCA
mmetsp:Transcript_103336/g.269160  ORF Transcript_103336/g.269160 Transcript_103336/m.269160 type:complete len:233 (+) Transcript_103336:499-1197(+)